MDSSQEQADAVGSEDTEPVANDVDPGASAPPVEGPILEEERLTHVLESLIFVSDSPISAARLARITKTNLVLVRQTLGALVERYESRGIELTELATGFQFRSSAENAPYARELIRQRPVRLTRAQLEALSIVAYRQPVTRPELEDIRGVDSGSALKVLLERGLLRILGRKEEPGRPLLYGTSPQFLALFGLKHLRDLPTLREFSELSEESRALFERRMGEPFERDELTDPSAVEHGVDDADPSSVAQGEVATSEDEESGDEELSASEVGDDGDAQVEEDLESESELAADADDDDEDDEDDGDDDDEDDEDEEDW